MTQCCFKNDHTTCCTPPLHHSQCWEKKKREDHSVICCSCAHCSWRSGAGEACSFWSHPLSYLQRGNNAASLLMKEGLDNPPAEWNEHHLRRTWSHPVWIRHRVTLKRGRRRLLFAFHPQLQTNLDRICSQNLEKDIEVPFFHVACSIDRWIMDG